ncbi:sulfatase [Campylobacter sp. MIT 12-5580]|uniref:LTA synthase family protein n=1 Tax=Campylobacter sp. MIT 12-5580 TaxID=2040651 RepID=UPI0010F99F8E|nr:alkaline phosphatase family protein [Campylobacter sp. MIT 12-5580]TKX29817.1 sulfatase [Campylobacter sp. MIT 12-5580]
MLTHRNFLLLCFVFALIFALSFFIMRLSLDLAFLPHLDLDEIFALYKMGFLLDMRAISPMLLIILCLGYIVLLKQKFACFLASKGFNSVFFSNSFDKRFIIFVVACFAAFVAFSALGGFYYFKAYHTKIDVFIFGLKDDDTAAILKIIWQDYPVLVITFVCVLYAFVCAFVAKKILLLSFARQSFILSVIINALVIVLLVVGVRGSIGTFPLREDMHHISKNPLVNHIATNPIIAFSWALKHYKEQENFHQVKLSEGKALEEKLFPIFFKETSPFKIQKPMNVVVVLMESFGTNMLYLDDVKDFDLLGEFRQHFEAGLKTKEGQSDFTFMRFLSSANGTAPSFAKLFFLSASANISLGQAKNTKLAFTPFDIYKKAGYEVVFITTGNRSWQNLGDYTSVLGADAVYDSNYIMEHFKGSRESKNTYGVLDEYAYKLAFEVLENATKPTFIAMLTTTNHPPFTLPAHFNAPQYKLEGKTQFFKYEEQEKIKNMLGVFTYASDAFGRFISQLKASKLASNTIIAGSGDHISRDVVLENPLLMHAVPLYMYIPKELSAQLHFDEKVLGSHKDIFPTLYALSLQEYEFLTLGGRNLFDGTSDERYNFALNDSIYIDKHGFFARGGGLEMLEYEFKDHFFMPTNKSFANEKQGFFKLYDELDWWQLNYRVKGLLE